MRGVYFNNKIGSPLTEAVNLSAFRASEQEREVWTANAIRISLENESSFSTEVCPEGPVCNEPTYKYRDARCNSPVH